MGASDPVEAAFRAVVEETARVYAAAGEWLRGRMEIGPRVTQKEIAQRYGYTARQVRWAVKVLRERMALGGRASSGPGGPGGGESGGGGIASRVRAA